MQALNAIKAFGSEVFRLRAQETPAVRREPPGLLLAPPGQAALTSPPSQGLPCPRPQRSWGTSSPPARPWGVTGASGARPASPCSPPGLRRRRGPRPPETRPRRRTRTSAGHTWGPASRQSLVHRSPAFSSRSPAGGGAPSLSAAEALQLTVKALLGPNTPAFPSPRPAPRTPCRPETSCSPDPTSRIRYHVVTKLHLIHERPPSKGGRAPCLSHEGGLQGKSKAWQVCAMTRGRQGLGLGLGLASHGSSSSQEPPSSVRTASSGVTLTPFHGEGDRERARHVLPRSHSLGAVETGLGGP